MCFGKGNPEEIKILLVDKMKGNLDTMENLLKIIGFYDAIDTIIGRATNSDMAVKEFTQAKNEKKPYQLIFMGLDYDGHYTAKLIRKLESAENTSKKNQVKIVPWTTMNEYEKTKEKCTSNGMISFLKKPTVKEDVKNILRDVLGLKLSVSLSPKFALRRLPQIEDSSTKTQERKSSQEVSQVTRYKP